MVASQRRRLLSLIERPGEMHGNETDEYSVTLHSVRVSHLLFTERNALCMIRSFFLILQSLLLFSLPCSNTAAMQAVEQTPSVIPREGQTGSPEVYTVVSASSSPTRALSPSSSTDVPLASTSSSSKSLLKSSFPAVLFGEFCSSSERMVKIGSMIVRHEAIRLNRELVGLNHKRKRGPDSDNDVVPTRKAGSDKKPRVFAERAARTQKMAEILKQMKSLQQDLALEMHEVLLPSS